MNISEHERMLMQCGQPCNGYAHVPLEDPERQIRLLRFLPHVDEDEINLEISIWALERTPEYVAISYTWGNEVFENIEVNGEQLRIRRNAHYALWKTRTHYPGAYVWIDSICIAQNERDEKGHQVRIMGSIFEQAQWVCACIGKHYDDSWDVVSTAKKLTYPRNTRASPIFFLKREEYVAVYPKLKRLLGREYFSRLWVVQEMAAGNHKSNIQILCGEDIIDKRDLDLLHDGCQNAVEQDSAPDQRYREISQGRFGSSTLEEICRRYYDFKCTDDRDRIFGVLSLVNWDERGQLVVPDYSLSPMQLAMNMSRYLRPAALYHLLATLRISCRDAMLVALEEQRSVFNDHSTRISENSNRAYRLEYATTCLYLTLKGSEGLQSEDPLSSTTLQCRFRVELAGPQAKLRTNTKESFEAVASHCLARTSWKYLWHAGYYERIAAVISAEARPGDLLIPRPFGRHNKGPQYMLVVRENLDGLQYNDGLQYDVIGQCVCFAGFDLPIFSPYDGHHEVSIRLTLDDYMVLVGQGATGDPFSDSTDPKWWYKRLETLPILQSKGAVLLNSVHNPSADYYACTLEIDDEDPVK